MNQKVLATLVVLIGAFIMAWFVFSTGADVVTDAPKSKIFNPAGDELKK